MSKQAKPVVSADDETHPFDKAEVPNPYTEANFKVLAAALEHAEDEVQNWTNTAATYAQNADYYRQQRDKWLRVVASGSISPAVRKAAEAEASALL